MTQEDKELLLKDLCARLPYGLRCDTYGQNLELIDIDIKRELVYLQREEQELPYSILNGDDVKPYLRPMSSMTEEEKQQTRDLWIDADTKTHATRLIDFYNKHHIDYRGLIEKGLALEAPKEMYN